jgi:hypothetical protein
MLEIAGKKIITSFYHSKKETMEGQSLLLFELLGNASYPGSSFLHGDLLGILLASPSFPLSLC